MVKTYVLSNENVCLNFSWASEREWNQIVTVESRHGNKLKPFVHITGVHGLPLRILVTWGIICEYRGIHLMYWAYETSLAYPPAYRTVRSTIKNIWKDTHTLK